MVRENLEVVMQLSEAMGRLMDSPEDLSAALALVDSEVEWIPLRAATEGAYRGHAGLRRFVEDTLENFEEFEPHFEYREVSGGRVLAWGTIYARGRGSGVEIRVPFGGLFEVRDGKVTRWEDFGSRERALDVAVVRASLDAFNESGPDAMAEFFDPDINWRAAEGAPDDLGEMNGVDAVRRYVQDWIDTFDEFRVAVGEIRDLGGDRVLAKQQVTGRAKISGAETDLHYAVVYTVRDGRIVRGREYLTVTQALDAVTLPE